ncbi:MAG: DEAD/DEAH box helicase [Kiritimatiellae bacterium]|nr:DEAD/DEAH box helicase [Kiritimatiellia bacterium]
MTTTFDDVLKRYRDESLSESEKGTKFEELMRAYLLMLPKFHGLFDKIWLWRDFPSRTDFGSGHDLGIDLVVRTVSGEYWAVQCKCYAENAYISKESVDTFLSTSGKYFSDELLETKRFSRRLWIATTDNWSAHAEETLKNQSPPVMRIGLADLIASPIDWDAVEAYVHGTTSVASVKRAPFDHQLEAIAVARVHFAAHDRGKLIMACGTGKTYTSLKIAEDQVTSTGLILFLVPSIALLGQTLNEWTANAEKPIRPMCVCSDAEVSKKQKATDDGGFTVEDLAFPASTNTDEIVRQFRQLDLLAKTNGGFRVVFSTYQSLPQVITAQQRLNAEKSHQADFDLVICDEAHRTTGAAVGGSRTGGSPVRENDGTNAPASRSTSAFILVHDNSALIARKRLYMTATPRIYNDRAKEDAKDADVLLCSMDDEAIYGKEFYHIGFGKAVEKGLLSDYKVLILTVPDIPRELKAAVTASNGEIKMDDAAKLVGCINALSKQMVKDSENVRAEDPSLMHKAVAFCANINASKQIVSSFNALRDAYYGSLTPKERAKRVAIEADHIDGTMGAALRQRKLAWLDSSNPETNACHVLSNVRCLSEGVDVPSLDAILFLSAKNSQVDVVQSVGRVMRKAPGKKYGYVIIPVVIPPDMSPEEALDNSDVYNVVWTVLNALRAHDDHFDTEINKIDLNKNASAKILVGVADTGATSSLSSGTAVQDEMDFNAKIYAKMVKKVGTRRYWSLWAEEVAKIAAKHSTRLRDLISRPGEKRDEFLRFLSSLRENLNPTVSEDEAADMLVQHALTKPVFDAIFEGYDFAASNVVSKSMQKMVDLLHEDVPEKEMRAMEEFYKSVAERAEGIDNAEGRQRVIYELYDKFFRTAFPKMSEQLGIVYTPVECVDFIINSVEDVLRKEFGQSLTDKDVHIIDPFTGTGTFITRLLQSGHIKPTDLKRKYTKELHANEIVLLAYYIASVNIESVYHDLMERTPDIRPQTSDIENAKSEVRSQKSSYQPFEGICLTDTFEMYEKGDVFETADFQQNSARVTRQKKTPVRIVIGNPPYSVGQKSANDNAQNAHYPKLEAAIARTYVAHSTAANKNALYDSYIKSFRWATDRLDGGKGIVAFISNAGWLDASAMDGFRATLEQEFDSIYVFNLRGNCRTSGELRKKEAGNVFGLGSRTPIAITLLVKKDVARASSPLRKVEGDLATSRKARIFYRDIGDYLSREKKLEIVKDMRSMLDPKMDLVEIHPNAKHDWINQRDGVFDSLIPIGDKDDKTGHTAFVPTYSCGLKTQRDTWCYNFSKAELEKNMQRTIEHYTHCLGGEPIYDAMKINWTRAMLNQHSRDKRSNFSHENIRVAVYRPFCTQYLYFDKFWNEMVYQIPRLFPTPEHKNRVICTCGAGGTKSFSCLMTDEIPDVQLMMNGQCFPLYVYEAEESSSQMTLFDKGKDSYRQESGITDFMLARCRTEFGDKVTKEDVFYYIYGVLHSPDYRKRFEADLKKSLARIPLCKTGAEFAAFVKAGHKLGDLHCDYESVKPWKDCVVDTVATSATLPLEKSPMSPSSPYHITKMRFAKKSNPHDEDGNGKLDRWEMEDRSRIIYNDRVTIRGIPLAAYDYQVNGKSAIEWVMDRYQVTINKDSGIVNDPNLWLAEFNNPRYIVDLILKVVTVSMETLKIVAGLPRLEF